MSINLAVRPILVALALTPGIAVAQSMPGMDMPMPRPSPTPPPAPTPPADDMGGMVMEDEAGMGGALGRYPMTRDASGTSWQPDSSPMTGGMGTSGGWSTMIDGYVTLIGDRQGGRRGDDKLFSTSMLMAMAQRPAGGGTLTLRGMISLDALMGRRGYPLLLATGETADGTSPLIDRQHPHDLLMELAAAYRRPLGGGVTGFVYLGMPGEPALGPATYMHRFSGMMNPEAPIAHHWLDSTHITFGVATLGIAYRGVKLETSLFTGREPDQRRFDLDRPRFDSWSLRATWNPGRNWSGQASYGVLRSPEQLEPGVNVRRTTASVTYDRPLGRAGRLQATLAWGRNDPSDRRSTDAVLLDGALAIGRNTLFGRIEAVEKDELFAGTPPDPLAGRVFTVRKASLGYARTVPLGAVGVELGGLVSGYGLPSALRPAYGRPVSGMLFVRLRVSPK